MAGTVTVGCKLPCGYVIEVFKFEAFQEPVMGGGTRTVQRAIKIPGRSVTLNGFARQLNKPVTHDIRFGVGLTHGVDADLFAQWLEQHKDDDLVKGGFIFANLKSSEVDAQAKDRLSLLSGLEAADPNNLPKEFKGKVATTTVAG